MENNFHAAGEDTGASNGHTTITGLTLTGVVVCSLGGNAQAEGTITPKADSNTHGAGSTRPKSANVGGSQ